MNTLFKIVMIAVMTLVVSTGCKKKVEKPVEEKPAVEAPATPEAPKTEEAPKAEETPKTEAPKAE